MSDYLIDNYVSTKPGEPYRLFPWGKLVKGGVTREIKPGMGFKLPHFKPPIKLGSHQDATPAGGHILALEEREDGLYAVPEVNEAGDAALQAGAYRYHSPEVLWEDGGIEDPTTGATIRGPLIVGDALLHTPHLGEAAALYSITPLEVTMTDEMVTVPKTLWERFSAWLDRKTAEPQPDPEPPVAPAEPEAFSVLRQERDDWKAKYEAMDAERKQAEQLAALAHDLQDKERFGMSFVELRVAEEAAGVLAGMSEEQRGWVMKNFSALAAQINESALTGEIGSDGEGRPTGDLHTATLEYATEHKVDYVAALRAVSIERPELVVAHRAASRAKNEE